MESSKQGQPRIVTEPSMVVSNGGGLKSASFPCNIKIPVRRTTNLDAWKKDTYTLEIDGKIQSQLAHVSVSAPEPVAIGEFYPINTYAVPISPRWLLMNNCDLINGTANFKNYSVAGGSVSVSFMPSAGTGIEGNITFITMEAPYKNSSIPKLNELSIYTAISVIEPSQVIKLGVLDATGKQLKKVADKPMIVNEFHDDFDYGCVVFYVTGSKAAEIEEIGEITVNFNVTVGDSLKTAKQAKMEALWRIKGLPLDKAQEDLLFPASSSVDCVSDDSLTADVTLSRATRGLLFQGKNKAPIATGRRYKSIHRHATHKSACLVNIKDSADPFTDFTSLPPSAFVNQPESGQLLESFSGEVAGLSCAMKVVDNSNSLVELDVASSELKFTGNIPVTASDWVVSKVPSGASIVADDEILITKQHVGFIQGIHNGKTTDNYVALNYHKGGMVNEAAMDSSYSEGLANRLLSKYCPGKETRTDANGLPWMNWLGQALCVAGGELIKIDKVTKGDSFETCSLAIEYPGLQAFSTNIGDTTISASIYKDWFPGWTGIAKYMPIKVDGLANKQDCKHLSVNFSSSTFVNDVIVAKNVDVENVKSFTIGNLAVVISCYNPDTEMDKFVRAAIPLNTIINGQQERSDKIQMIDITNTNKLVLTTQGEAFNNIGYSVTPLNFNFQGTLAFPNKIAMLDENENLYLSTIAQGTKLYVGFVYSIGTEYTLYSKGSFNSGDVVSALSESFSGLRQLSVTYDAQIPTKIVGLTVGEVYADKFIPPHVALCDIKTEAHIVDATKSTPQ